jgi:hypothetical protein
VGVKLRLSNFVSRLASRGLPGAYQRFGETCGNVQYVSQKLRYLPMKSTWSYNPYPKWSEIRSLFRVPRRQDVIKLRRDYYDKKKLRQMMLEETFKKAIPHGAASSL